MIKAVDLGWNKFTDEKPVDNIKKLFKFYFNHAFHYF